MPWLSGRSGTRGSFLFRCHTASPRDNHASKEENKESALKPLFINVG